MIPAVDTTWSMVSVVVGCCFVVWAVVSMGTVAVEAPDVCVKSFVVVSTVVVTVGMAEVVGWVVRSVAVDSVVLLAVVLPATNALT